MFHAWNSQTWVKLGSSSVIQVASCAASKNLSSCCRSFARIQRALAINPRKPPSATVVNASTGGAFSKALTRVRPSCSRSRFNTFCIWPEPATRTTASSSSRIFFVRGFMCADWKSSKLQAPSSREIPNPKPQAAPSKASTWCLALGASLDVGCWMLELSLRSLRRRQFPPAKHPDARQRDDAAEQQDDLPERQPQF